MDLKCVYNFNFQNKTKNYFLRCILKHDYVVPLQISSNVNIQEVVFLCTETFSCHYPNIIATNFTVINYPGASYAVWIVFWKVWRYDDPVAYILEAYPTVCYKTTLSLLTFRTKKSHRSLHLVFFVILLICKNKKNY